MLPAGQRPCWKIAVNQKSFQLRIVLVMPAPYKHQFTSNYNADLTTWIDAPGILLLCVQHARTHTQACKYVHSRRRYTAFNFIQNTQIDIPPLLARQAEVCMMMSSNGNIFRVTGHLCGEFTGQNYSDLRPNKRLSKQSWGWWFETLSWSLWRHYNGNVYREFSDLCSTLVIVAFSASCFIELRCNGTRLYNHACVVLNLKGNRHAAFSAIVVWV